MGATIDHLTSDLQVIVRRDFTDHAGVPVRAETRGIVRSIAVDMAKQEIRIGFERDGELLPLRFALFAKTGPRNGHMRDFFEAVETVYEPRQPKPSAPEPELPESDPKQRAVACDCDPAFHRPCLPASDLSLHGCLSCGTIACSRIEGDDGRFTGKPYYAYIPIELGKRTLDWLAKWPRIKPDYGAKPHRWPMGAEFLRYPTLYYPPETRCSSLVQLAELESRLAQEQSALSDSDRLRATHRATAAPPSNLPPSFHGYARLWEALQLRPESELSSLIELAQLGSAASGVAAGLLLRRHDAFDVMIQSLQSYDPIQQSAGFAMARDSRPADPRLPSILLEILRSLPLSPLPNAPDRIVSWRRFESILLLIAELKLDTPEVIEALRGMLRPLARLDTTIVNCIRIVLSELQSAPIST